MRPTPAVILALATAMFVGPSPLYSQSPGSLPVGTTATGQVSNGSPAVFGFTAPSAGVLTVAVHAASDVALTVTDVDGQTLPDGATDRDLFGSGGNEQLMVSIPEGGEYRVVVELLGNGNSAFDIGGAWIAMAAFARPSDPDGRPSQAVAIDIGQSLEDSLDTDQGDSWDWFVVTAKAAGTLTVILRSITDDSPDLALELYLDDDLTDYVVRSDDDLQGNTTNESATVDVKAGQKVYVKVLGATGGPTGAYRLASSLIE